MDYKRITFKKKPIPLPVEYRPMYQIAIISMVLRYCCRGNVANLQKLHLFSWSLYSESNMSELKKLVENDYRTHIPHWAIDPALNRALVYAVEDKICELTSNKKYKLTTKGISFVDLIELDNDLFQQEKLFLNQIGKQITDDVVDKLTLKR